MYEGFREDFLRANANKEFIGQQFTEVVRNLMRAIGATSQPRYSVDRAAEQMQFVVELLQRSDDPPTFHELFEIAADDLGQIPARSESQAEMLEVAQIGVSLIAEWTSTDNAAGARISKRKSEFLAAVREIWKSDRG